VTPVLRFDGVWKGYTDWSGAQRSVRGIVARRVPALRRGRNLRWALRDISLSLPAGSSLGLIGHNGAGKSTFLRLASRLGRPTRGLVHVAEDAATVLNLGTSFDPQLSGRDNAYTAARVGGLSSRAADAALPRALEFAELEEFAEAPLWTYSDGMRLRLAFGVVAQLHPELLVLDEVMAVGDLAFREKCARRIDELRADGVSVVLASHAFEEVARVCDQAIWLHHGLVRAHGDVETVIAEYEQAVHETTLELTPVGAGRDDRGLALGENRFGTQELTLDEIQVSGGAGREPTTIPTGAALDVSVLLRAHAAPVDDPIVTVSLRRRTDGAIVLDCSTRASGATLGPRVREARVRLRVGRLDLPGGDYAVDVGAFQRDWEYAYDYHAGAYPLRVDGSSGGKGLVLPPLQWSMETA
jgi:lipopolysaccharide transport system ATP-binding protein